MKSFFKEAPKEYQNVRKTRACLLNVHFNISDFHDNLKYVCLT